MKILKANACKLVAVLLAVVMLFSVTACNPDTKKSRWTMSDGDIATAIEVSLSLAENDEQKKITATYSEDIFKSSISANDVVVQAYAQSDAGEETDGDTQDSEDVSVGALSGVNVTYVSAREIEISFEEERQDIWMYFVYIHPDSVIQNVFAAGEFFSTVVIDLEETPYAAIEGEYTNLTENPVITVTLENTEVSQNITADSIKLGGAFSSLSVSSVAASGSTVRISTKGRVAAGTSLTGIVKIASDALACGKELSAATEVVYKAIYIDDASWEYKDDSMIFDVVSLEDNIVCTVEELGKYISTDRGADIQPVSVSQDGSSVRLSVAGHSADETAQSLAGDTLNIQGPAFRSGAEHSVYIGLTAASLRAAVDYISVSDGVATATAYLYAYSGTLETLNKSDLSFTGDYAGATVTKLDAQSDSSYIVEFTFATEAPAEDFSMSGALSLPYGKVINLWGTESGAVSADAAYVYISDRGETWDEIKGFIDTYKGTFETIGTVGSVIGGVASAASGIYSVLQLIGVIESTDDKLDKINRSLDNIQSSIHQIDKKLDTLSSLITQNSVEEAERSYLTLRNNASQSWNMFLERVSALDDAISSYTSAYYGYILDFVNSASNEITLYWNADGELTVPGSVAGYDLTGTSIVSQDTVVLNCSFESVRGELAAHGNAVYDGIFDDISTVIQNDGNTAERTEDIIDALMLGSAKKAVEKVGAQNIVNAFRNMCYALVGSTAGSPASAATVTPLDNYYTMLGCYYNFASEAEGDMEQMLGWLSGYALRGAGLATFAMSCMSGLSESERNSVNASYAMAVDEIKAHDNLHETESGKQWSFVVDNTISTVQLEVSLASMSSLALYYIGTWNRFTDTNFLNLTHLQIMRNRYNRLYQAKVVSSATFADYLVGAGVISNELKNAYAVTSFPVSSAIPTDNSVSLKCDSVYSGSWFKYGQSYSIGTSGKYNAKHFKNICQLTGQAYHLTDGSTTTRFGGFGEYFEFHWYWFGDNEWAGFHDYLSDSFPLIAFTIG